MPDQKLLHLPGNGNFVLTQSNSDKKKKLNQLIIDTVRLILDTPVAFYFTFPGKINGKTAGLLGTITSIIGMYQMWPEPAPAK
jgi:hypothetical protein